jgi:hypothetical protein
LSVDIGELIFWKPWNALQLYIKGIMAEIFNDLLQAMDDDLEARIDDTTFTWLKSHEIIDPAEVIPDEFSLELPAILVYGAITSITPLCIGGDAEEKTYQMTMTVLRESSISARYTFVGDAYDVGLHTMVEELETLYRRETFNLSDVCQMLPPDFSTRIPTELGDRTIVQAHVTFQHTYVDSRGDSLFRYIMKASGIQALSATDSLTVTHPTMRVASDGGDVTLTSLPNIVAGTDQQFVIVEGTSDTNYVTFQDSSNLVGSGLKLAGKRDMTLALNDSLPLKYSASQGAWIETMGRTDVY